MIEKNELKELLEYYGLDYERIINKNKKVITNGKPLNINEIIEFFINNNIDIKTINNAPSLLFLSTKNNIEKTYNYLINETEITKKDIEGCIHILSSNVNIIKNNYNYLIKNFDIEFIKKLYLF